MNINMPFLSTKLVVQWHTPRFACELADMVFSGGYFACGVFLHRIHHRQYHSNTTTTKRKYSLPKTIVFRRAIHACVCFFIAPSIYHGTYHRIRYAHIYERAYLFALLSLNLYGSVILSWMWALPPNQFKSKTDIAWVIKTWKQMWAASWKLGILISLFYACHK